jgi:cell division protein FtsB
MTTGNLQSLHDLRPAATRRSRVRLALKFVSMALLLNAIAGERGLIDMLRARKQHRTLASSIATLRVENDRLREMVRRLTVDPATIEALARRELGLARRGELLFIVKDQPRR